MPPDPATRVLDRARRPQSPPFRSRRSSSLPRAATRADPGRGGADPAGHWRSPAPGGADLSGHRSSTPEVVAHGSRPGGMRSGHRTSRSGPKGGGSVRPPLLLAGGGWSGGGSQSSAWEGEEGASGSRSSVPPLAAGTARQWAATAAGREALGPRQGRPPSRPVEDAREGACMKVLLGLTLKSFHVSFPLN